MVTASTAVIIAAAHSKTMTVTAPPTATAGEDENGTSSSGQSAAAAAAAAAADAEDDAVAATPISTSVRWEFVRVDRSLADTRMELHRLRAALLTIEDKSPDEVAFGLLTIQCGWLKKQMAAKVRRCSRRMLRALGTPRVGFLYERVVWEVPTCPHLYLF